MIKAKVRGLDGRVYLELRRVVAEGHARVRRFYKRMDQHGQFTPAREAGLKRRRDRRAAARAVQPASAAQAVQAEASPSPARSSSQETIIIPPAMYVRDPAASAERRSLSLGMVRRVERRNSSPVFPVMSVPETPPRDYSVKLEEESQRSIRDLEGMRVILPPRLSDFDFNTLVSDLVSTALERDFCLGDDVDVLRLLPSLNPQEQPLRTFISDIVLRTVFSGFEHVRYHMRQRSRRLQEAAEASQERGHPSRSSSSSLETPEDEQVRARRRSSSPRRRSGEVENKEERGRKSYLRGCIGGAVVKIRGRKGKGAIIKKTRAD